MADATWAVPHFYGGEISQFAQGRFDKPDYRNSLNVCLNSFPVEIGAWTRRPGTVHAGPTRAGAAGRVLKFDFEQDNAVTLEFTDAYLRFWSGATLITSNDEQAVVAVSTANPAVVQTTSAVDWVTGNTLIFDDTTALLQNRQFIATKIDTTHFSLADALTGVAIDGSTLGTIGSGTVHRVHELSTAYVSSAWSSIRAVQAETTDILLTGSIAPQALTVSTLPSDGINPQFAVAPAVFNDGPYLDPFTNGVLATPSAKLGVITITLSFSAYDSAKAYAEGAFVTSAGINYVSLIDQNVGNTPAITPTAWEATSPAAAVNDGRGFLGSDIGRLVRLLSEPAAFVAATTYSVGNVVSYNPSGIAGAATYWQALTTTTTTPPGSDLVHWQIVPSGAAVWTWGKITALSNIIDRSLAGSLRIGDMTVDGGLVAAFDGVFSKVATSSAVFASSGNGIFGATTLSISTYVGKNYSAASDQVIQQALVYPSSDLGLAFGSYYTGSVNVPFSTRITLNLRGSATAPASASNGTLLATSVFDNQTAPVLLISTDQTTAWKYVWVEIEATSSTITFAVSWSFNAAVAQVSFFNPTGTGTSSGITLEILGPSLLSTTSIPTWRLGVYSDTTGYPTCGTYYEGRLWLGGAVANRFDACVSNGIEGGTVNFAPTDQFGVVAASNAISYTLNSDSSNPIHWMSPDLQGIIMGTQAGEFLVQAPTTGPLAPANIAARRVTRIGCANIEPRRTEHTMIFVKRYGRKLMEFFSDASFGKFSAPNIADKAGHIVSAGIAEIAYTEAVAPIVWGRDNDGALFGITYKRDALTTQQPPAFCGWHRHTLGSGRTVESICNGPSVGGDLDTLTMITNDPDTNIRYVELLTDTPDENTALGDAWFLDGAVVPTSTVSSATPIAAASGDPFFSSVVFLASFEQAEASGTNYTEQSSFHANVVFSSPVGVDNNSQSNISTTLFEYGGASARSSNTTSASVADSANWDLSDTNGAEFTIEYSYYQTERAGNYNAFNRLQNFGQFAWNIRHTGANLDFFYSPDGTTINSTSAVGAITAGNMGKWTKYRLSKNSAGKIRIFVDGVMVASATPADSTMFHSTLALGVNGSAASQVSYQDNSRITKGVCRDDSDANYTLATAAFPTAPPLVTDSDTGAPYGGMTLNGLWHLNGETVQVFAGGVDCGDRGTGSTGYTDFLVTNGSCFVPFGDGISAGPGRGLFTQSFANSAAIVVGFTYNSDGQMVRPIAPGDSGARNGPALGKTRRNHQYSVLVSNTLGVSFGGTFDVVRPADFRQANGNPIAGLTMYSGVHHDSLEDGYSYDGMLCWRVSRPWPANIVAISGNIRTQDR